MTEEEDQILSTSYQALLFKLHDHFVRHGGVDLALQVIKLQEEAGEVAAAYIGLVGSNPRKGVTHSAEDVAMEMADVAITALLGIRIAGFKPDEMLRRQAQKTRQRLDEFTARAMPSAP
jgi:phosphoribosyl-ATP pyrophosphohydrolase